MSYTNKTPNYELPQWLADDKPTFLSDMNGAFSDIDTAMKANENAAASAQSTADANTLSINGITTDIDGAGGVKARLSAVETAESNLEGSVNTINSLIGNGTPTTTDQTIIGAINEIHAFTGEGPLDTTAQTVTGAINELAAGALDDLSDVTITNPQSGDALVFNGTDWVNQAGGAGGTVVYKQIAEAVYDGTKTNKDMLDELYAAYDAMANKPSPDLLILHHAGDTLLPTSNTGLRFSISKMGTSNFTLRECTLANNASSQISADISSTFNRTDQSSNVANVRMSLWYLSIE